VRRGAGVFAGVLGKVTAALVAAAVLGVTGYGWFLLRDFNRRVVVADVLSPQADAERPLDGTVDILLVGMDSRTDARGRPLSAEQRKLLRVNAGDGEVNTDTIILVHVPSDTSRAVAVSIPRDSYVDIPGFGMHKINSAYPRGRNVERERLLAAGMPPGEELERRSHQAGARVLLETVEKLTGRTIDHYASVNLLGFYEITKAIGGIEVCLKAPVQDVKSHADFPAGRQVISEGDALAFVRQRHGLPRGDLDRIVRQQVFLTGLARKVLSTGTLTDPQRLNDLMDAITRSVVLSKGWDIMAFAQRMSSLTTDRVEFRTIPVGSLALPTPADGAAVEVDPQRVREFIASLSEEEDEEAAAARERSSSAPPPPGNSSAPPSTTGSAPPSATTSAPPPRAESATPPEVPPSTAQPPEDGEQTPEGGNRPITADEIPCVN